MKSVQFQGIAHGCAHLFIPVNPTAMRPLTHCTFFGSIWLVVACLVAVSGCGDDSTTRAAEQRDLGTISLSDSLLFSLRPGTIDQHTPSAVQGRASVPLPDFFLSSGPLAAEQIRIKLANIHRDATIRVVRDAPLNALEMPNCPETPERAPIECMTTPEHPICAAPALSRTDLKRSEISLVVDLDACTRRSFRVERSADAHAAQPRAMRMAVLGRADTLGQLRLALEAAIAEAPDFVLLLGDMVENSSLNGLRDLDFLLRELDYPAVVLPGEDELVDGKRTRFLEVFGPLDFGWDVGNVHFYTFYSANAKLSDNAILRLRNVLERLDPSRPTLLFTHTPPTDPLGPRDQGFHSQIQAARVLSLISDSEVDAFFVGHIRDSASVDLQDIKIYLTSIARSAEYLWVEVEGDALSVTRRTL